MHNVCVYGYNKCIMYAFVYTYDHDGTGRDITIEYEL